MTNAFFQLKQSQAMNFTRILAPMLVPTTNRGALGFSLCR